MPSNKELTPEELAMQDLLTGPQYGISNVTPPGPDPMETFVKPAIIPTALTGIGGAVAGLPGAMLGGMGGEMINQAVGLTPRSDVNIGLSLAAPVVGPAARTGARMFGARGAATINALAPQEMAAGVAKLEPQIASKYLFDTATQSGALLPMNKTLASIDTMVSDLKTSAVAEKVRKPAISALERLKLKIQSSGGQVTPKQIQAELEGLGDMVSQAEGKAKGAFKSVFKAMSHDLDDAANSATSGSSAAETLKEARSTWKREQAVRELKDALMTATKNLRGQGADVQFNAPAIMRELRDNEFIQQAFSKQELGELESLLTKMNKIPALRPGAGQQAGSRNVLQGVTSGAGIGTLGSFATGIGSPGAAALLGGAAGVVLPPTAELISNIALAMSMKTGRAMMGQLLKNSDRALTPQALSMISAYAEAVRAGAEGAVAP
jgi:hypothetical protein